MQITDLIIQFLTATELTISSDAITVTQANHKLQPQSGTSDNLSTINGTSDGQFGVLYASDFGTDTITIKHNVGNILCVGAADIALSHGCVFWYSDGTKVFCSGGGGGGSSGATPHGACGRLTPTSGKPVENSDVTGAGTIYWEPFNGDLVPLWNGSTFTETTIAALSLTLNNPNHAASTIYPVFIFDDAGTKRLGTGPAWTSSSARGTGAGTGELEIVNGIKVNKVSMTARNGSSTYTVAARSGTHVGDIVISSTVAQVNFSKAAGERGIWNRYNQQLFTLKGIDTTDNWNYTTATWRAANNNTTNGVGRVSFILGEAGGISARVISISSNSSSVWTAPGIGLDVTNANSADMMAGAADSAVARMGNAFYSGMLAAGSHFVQRLEISEAAGTTNWKGDTNLTFIQSGMTVDLWM